MNLGEAKQRAIKLISEYSQNGVVQAAALNADYTLRMNAYADMCQSQISDRAGINATYLIDPLTKPPDKVENGNNKWNLPADYKDHRYVKVADYYYNDYKMEDRQFIVGSNDSQVYVLHYFKYPTTIDDTTPDGYNFEVDPYTQHLIPYFLGGMATMNSSEDSAVSGKLMNLYYAMLDKLYKREIRYPRRAREVVRW